MLLSHVARQAASSDVLPEESDVSAQESAVWLEIVLLQVFGAGGATEAVP